MSRLRYATSETMRNRSTTVITPIPSTRRYGLPASAWKAGPHVLHDPIVESRLGEHQTQPERDADEEKRCPVHTRLERKDVDHLQHEHENECRKTDRHGGDVVERLGCPQNDRHQDDGEHALLHRRKRPQAIGNRLVVVQVRPSARGLASRFSASSCLESAHSAAPTKRVPQRSEDCSSDWALPGAPTVSEGESLDSIASRCFPSPVHPHNQEVVQRKHDHQPRQRRHKPRRHVELLLHIGRQRRHDA